MDAWLGLAAQQLRSLACSSFPPSMHFFILFFISSFKKCKCVDNLLKERNRSKKGKIIILVLEGFEKEISNSLYNICTKIIKN